MADDRPILMSANATALKVLPEIIKGIEEGKLMVQDCEIYRQDQRRIDDHELVATNLIIKINAALFARSLLDQFEVI